MKKNTAGKQRDQRNIEPIIILLILLKTRGSTSTNEYTTAIYCADR